jgi:peptide/nickel transport system permease protein
VALEKENNHMREYIIKRISIAVLVLFVIASLNFTLFQVIAPMDPTATILDPNFTFEMRQQLLQDYGLLDPLYIRYVKYLRNMFTWNFGFSFQSRENVAQEMSWRVVNSVLLLGTALIGTVLLGISVGVFAGSRRKTAPDVLAVAAGLFADGVPTFFIQMISLLFFSYLWYLWFGFQVFPARGITSVPVPTDPFAYMADVAWHLAQPALTLIIAAFGGWALYTRNLIVDALTQDYVTTARAKGLSERIILYRHAFRSALPPITTMVALSVPGIFTGAMITEYIFTWPGVGAWYIAALNSGDFPVVQSVLFIYAILMLCANLVADLLYGALDPRIRVGVRR